MFLQRSTGCTSSWQPCNYAAGNRGHRRRAIKPYVSMMAQRRQVFHARGRSGSRLLTRQLEGPSAAPGVGVLLTEARQVDDLFRMQRPMLNISVSRGRPMRKWRKKADWHRKGHARRKKKWLIQTLGTWGMTGNRNLPITGVPHWASRLRMVGPCLRNKARKGWTTLQTKGGAPPSRSRHAGV